MDGEIVDELVGVYAGSGEQGYMYVRSRKNWLKLADMSMATSTYHLWILCTIYISVDIKFTIPYCTYYENQNSSGRIPPSFRFTTI